MKSLILVMFSLMTLSHSVNSATCSVDSNPAKNKGWCVEGVDGLGKCIIIEVEDADRCSESGTGNPILL